MMGLTSRSQWRRVSRRSRRSKGQAGATLVEFALVSICFLTILFGIVGFGHAFYAYHFVDHAAKEASRWAAVNGLTCNNDAALSTNGKGSCMAPVTCSKGTCTECASSCAPAAQATSTTGDITNFVTMMIPEGINPNNVTVSATWPGNGTTYCATAATANGPSCPVQVTVSYAYTFFVPLVHTSPITLSSTSIMTIAH
jgi:Flp pilus assembly protein TadG